MNLDMGGMTAIVKRLTGVREASHRQVWLRQRPWPEHIQGQESPTYMLSMAQEAARTPSSPPEPSTNRSRVRFPLQDPVHLTLSSYTPHPRPTPHTHVLNPTL